MSLLDILNQALNSNNQSSQTDALNQAAQQVPADVLGRGLAEAFRSEQTPEIGNMVGQLFGQSDGKQQAGVLNTIIGSLGPAAAAALAGGVLNNILGGGRDQQITPEQAAQLTPQQVQDVVNEANANNPDIADKLADFYANNKTLVNTLGGLAASIALMKIKDHLSRNDQ
ncbi:MAG: hypothetical protein Q4G39_03900 [Brachymonas sp.]|nr:hypothetical protein [Brachymonas sp.]